MNERIRLLADKIWEEKYWTNPNTDKLLPAQLNRFAELIVEECADKAHEFIIEDGDEFPLQAVSYRIKQHFGVEE
jgi:hypothetical protein